MTKSISIIIFLFVFSALFAQTDDEKQKAEINKIKKSKNYIYGEATLKDKDEALDLAKEILLRNINDWVESEKKMKQSEMVVVREIIENSENISLLRGNMFRAFVYVQKKNILPVDDIDKSVVLSRSKTDEEQTIAVNEIKKIEQPNQISDDKNSVLDQIIWINRSDDVLPLFQQLKAEQKLVYGKLSTMPSAESCYMLIYNKAGEVVSVLDKGHNKNLRTLENDDPKNYSGCGALWFQTIP